MNNDIHLFIFFGGKPKQSRVLSRENPDEETQMERILSCPRSSRVKVFVQILNLNMQMFNHTEYDYFMVEISSSKKHKLLIQNNPFRLLIGR